MNSTLLKKYETIDQSKVSEKDKKVLEQLKKLTNGFEETDEAKNKVAEKILDQITTLNPDAVKKPQVVAQKVAKVKKVAKAKKPATTSTAKKSGNNIMSVAKEIQKAGESWKDAMERAKQVLKERREGVVAQKKSELEKLYALVKTKKELQGFANSDIERDSVRESKVKGARVVTREGYTSNQYKQNVPNKLGRRYWESRENRSDRLAPNYQKDMPLLAGGGELKDAPFEVFVFKSKLRFDNELPSSSKGDFPTFAKAKEFAIDMIDSGNYYANIMNKSGNLWGVSSNGVEQFAYGGMTNLTMQNVSFAKGGSIKEVSKISDFMKYLSSISNDNTKTSNRDVNKISEFMKFLSSISNENKELKSLTLKIQDDLRGVIKSLNSKEKISKEEISSIQDDLRDVIKSNESGSFANGGEIKSVVDALFEFNEKRGKLNTSFGAKTKEGITALIENDNYSSEEIAKAIFYSNNKKEKISTGYGDKSFFGLQDMIERARGKEFANGGSINMDKHIWEGWTVGDFIEELEPTFNQIMRGSSWQKPFKTKDEVKAWAMDNQPYYKKNIPDVVNYFWAKVQSKDNYADGGDIKKLESSLLNAEKKYRKAILSEQVGIISPEELKREKTKLEDIRAKVNEWYATKPIGKKMADGGMNNLTIQNVSFAKGGKVKHTFKVGEIVSFPTQKNPYMDKPILDRINYFSNKELVIEKINEDKPYNLADVYVKDTGEKLRDLILNPKVLKIYPNNLEDKKNVKIKDWYLENYPTDDLGEELDENNTFQDIWTALHNGIDVYEVMGVGDSVIRERVFEETSKIYGIDYEYVYKKWLDSDDYAKGGSVSNERLYNFLQDDLQKLEEAIKSGDMEQVNVFFNYWLGSSGHLKSLETKNNERMYNFLKEDLEKLEVAVENGDTEQVDIFFSYWGQHLESLKMANGGSLPFMTDPNFGNFQNTGAFAYGGETDGYTLNHTVEFTTSDNDSYLRGNIGGDMMDLIEVENIGDNTYSAIAKSYSVAFEGLKGQELEDEVYNQINEMFATNDDIEVDLESVKIVGKFELGGAFMMTDLAGHTGGSDGLGNPMPLSGVSGTYYTGLVGETGAMSSGELFMDGGAMAQNQQVINDASQSYVNYYLGEGASQGIYKDGGAIKNQYKGRNSGEIWDNWTKEQRRHFLQDHLFVMADDEHTQNYKGEKVTKKVKKYDGSFEYEYVDIDKLINTDNHLDLPFPVSSDVRIHVMSGQYAYGGKTKSRPSMRELYIENIAYLTNTREVGVDAFAKEHNLTDSELSNLMTGLGRKMISQSDFITALVGNKNNPKQKEVVAFAKSDKAYKMADGGFTPDVSDGTQFMSGVYANGGSVGDDFQEVIDLGSEQYYTRPYGIVESESNGEVELVAVATIKDLEDYMSEDELPEEGNFQLDITLVPTEQFISEEILESANDEDSSSISDDSVINVVNYAGGLNYSPQERVFFETHQDALDYLMSDELKEQINRDSFSSDYIMYKQYNRLGQTNSEYLDYLMGVTDRFAKGGGLDDVKINPKNFSLKEIDDLTDVKVVSVWKGIRKADFFNENAERVYDGFRDDIKKIENLKFSVIRNSANVKIGHGNGDSLFLEMIAYLSNKKNDETPYYIEIYTKKGNVLVKKLANHFISKMENGGSIDYDYYEQLAVYVQGKGSIYNGTSMKKALEKANSYLKNNPKAEIAIVDEKYGDEYDFYGNLKDDYAKGGFVGTVEFNAGDIVWQKDEKGYATVMNNYGDPINGISGEIRLDTTGNTPIFTYNKDFTKETGYNLVKLGEKGDTGKFTPEVLDEMKEAGKRYIGYAKENKGSQQKENIAYYEGIYNRVLDGEFDSFAKPNISSQTTYVPNADVKELSVVVKGELKKLTGSDIVNGVYVKNSAKSTAKVDANAVFTKILKDAKEAKSGKTKRFDASDLKMINIEMIQKLVDAGYTEQQVRNVIFGYAFDNEILADNELEYDNGIFSYEENYVKEKIDDLVEAQKNKEFVAGIEYPDFDWQGIIKKYKISSKPKQIVIKRNFGSGRYIEYYYEVFVGENIALGHNFGYKDFDANGKLTGDYIEKGKKVSDPTKQNAWQKEREQKAGFNGGYWYVVSSKIETIDDVLKTLLSQKGGYCKELELYSDSFPKTLKENKIDFADGGELTNLKKGGRVSVNYSGRKSEENWGKNDLYEMYDNSIDLDADLADYFKDYEKDFGKEEADREKKKLIETLKLGKINFNDGASLTFANGGEMQGNNIDAELEDFDLDNLDDFERMQYYNFSKSSGKVGALQILINSVEGDYTQLSPELAELAEMQMSSEEYDEATRQMRFERDGYANGGFMNDVYAKGGSLNIMEERELKTFVNSLFNRAKNKIDNDKGNSLFVLSDTVIATKDSLGNPKFYLGVKKVQNSRPTYVVGSGFLSSDMLVYESYKKDSRFLETESIVEAKKFLTDKVKKQILHLRNKSVMADGGFMNNVYAKGGELQGKFLAEIKVPYNFEDVVEDEYEFSRFLSKALTNKFNFGNGAWGVKIVKPLFEKDYSKKIVVEIEIPVGVTQGGGLDKYDVTEFMSKTLTKKWFGNGVWGVDIISNFANGGSFLEDNEGFMRADNEFNYRYPEKEVYIETLDEPIDLTDTITIKSNEVVISPIDENIDLNDDNRVRARMTQSNRGSAENFGKINPRAFEFIDLPMPTSNTHKND